MTEDPARSERALALSYAPPAARDKLAAVFSLDGTFGAIVRSTREPIVGQMRLTWWHEALTKLDAAPPPAEPVLQALAASVVPVTGGAALAAMVDGWEALLEPELDDAAIDLFASGRGARLFAVLAALCDVGDSRIARAGEGWALADLSQRISNPSIAEAVESIVAAGPGDGRRMAAQCAGDGRAGAVGAGRFARGGARGKSETDWSDFDPSADGALAGVIAFAK
jgi:phytoene synthase